MNKSYFDEKKKLAANAIQSSMIRVELLATGTQGSSFDERNADFATYHEHIRAAINHLEAARRDIEKMRWAKAATTLDFAAWLVNEGYPELVKC